MGNVMQYKIDFETWGKAWENKISIDLNSGHKDSNGDFCEAIRSILKAKKARMKSESNYHKNKKSSLEKSIKEIDALIGVLD